MNPPSDIQDCLPGWPSDCLPSECSVFASNHLQVPADATTLWGLLVDATQWPRWYGNARNVKILDDSKLQLGTLFSWITFGLPIDSVVTTFQEPFQLGWMWHSRGWPGTAWGYHGWSLTPQLGGTLVRTDESQRGLAPRLLRSVLRPVLKTGHAHWLKDLAKRGQLA